MVRRFGSSGAVACGATALLALLALSPARAQNADLPSVKLLKCETGCKAVTDPKPIGKHSVSYPVIELRDYGQSSEAYVLVRFTVAADGSVKEPVLEKLLGAPVFAKRALEDLADWRYEPATAGGVPVDRVNWFAEIRYTAGPHEGASSEAIHVLNEARDLVGEKKFAEAKAAVEELLAKPRLRFYERAMASYLLAVSNMALKDYMTARENIEDATFFDGEFLDKSAREPAARMRIVLDAMTGHFADALDWFEKLKKLATVKPDDVDAQLVEKVRKRLDDSSPILIGGRIPVSGYLPIWREALLRRNFAFPETDGKVERFELRCDQQEIASAISVKAEWHVPKGFSNCHLDVFGAPGATFQLVETND